MEALIRAGLLFVAAALWCEAAHADPIPLDYGPWTATLYAGPATNAFFTHIITGRFKPNGAMAGLAVDARLYRLGSGFSFLGEAQITQYGFGHIYSTGALGIGVRYDWAPYNNWPMSISLCSGPSYATDPPVEKYFHGKALLNYVGIEYTSAIPRVPDWDIAVRFYHRSGAFGLYSPHADEGTMAGIGLRKLF